jgi:hypothetical protein
MTENSSPWSSERVGHTLVLGTTQVGKTRLAFELTSPAPANSHQVGKGRQSKSTLGSATQSAITAQAGLKPQRRPKPATPKTRR